MPYDDYGTGDGDFFDFDGDGNLDSFELAEMLNEQDRECEALFRGDIGRENDDDLLDDPEPAENFEYYSPVQNRSRAIRAPMQKNVDKPYRASDRRNRSDSADSDAEWEKIIERSNPQLREWSFLKVLAVTLMGMFVTVKIVFFLVEKI